MTTKGSLSVGGWLLLFCISITILTPYSAWVTLSHAPIQDLGRLEPANLWFSVISLLLTGTMGVLGPFAGVALWRKAPGAVKLAKLFCVVAMAYWAFTALALPLIRINDPALARRGLYQALGRVGYYACWLIYLFKSARVRITYGEPLAAAVLASASPAASPESVNSEEGGSRQEEELERKNSRTGVPFE
jgi:hypothetical protein